MSSVASSAPAASAAAAARKRAGGASEFGFLKTLASDLDDAAVQKLMLEVKTSDPMYKDFTTRDLKLLASMLSALRFEPGDKIVCKGEEASFLGLVLKGSFACVVDDRPGVALRRGELFGELEFFEAPALRKHDMVAATAGVIGVLSYEDVKLVGLTSIDLHLRLMQLIAVSSVRKLRQQYQQQQQSPNSLGGGGSVTPRVRSRRGSMTTMNGQQQQQQLNSAASSPAMAAPLSIHLRPGIGSLSLGAGIDGGGSPPPQQTPTPTLESSGASPTLLVGDEAAIASAVAAAIADGNAAADNSKLRRADSAPDTASSANGGLELLFRCRMKKGGANSKPRRIEADAIDLVADASGAANGVVFPPLKEGRSSFPGSSGGGPSAASGASPPLASSSLAGSSSSSSSAAATDKSNYNYILYALRNKVAKQEDAIEERDAQIAAMQTEQRAAREQATLDAQRITELEARNTAAGQETLGSHDRIRKLESEIATLRADLSRASKAVQQLEAERKTTQDQTAALVASMQARLKEHAELMDEPVGTGQGITAAAAAAEAAAATASSSSANNSPSKSALLRLASSSSYTKYSPRPIAPAAKTVYSATNHATQLDSLASVTAQYDSLLCHVSSRFVSQDRALSGLHKWKSRASEFAHTWDLERKLLHDRIKALLLEIEALKTHKDSYKILLKVLTVKLFMQHSTVRRMLRDIYRACVQLTTQILLEQRASGGGGLGAEEGRMLHGRAGVTQADNTDELLVRNHRKMQEKPWGRGGGGSGAQAASGARPAVSPAQSTRGGPVVAARPSRPAPLKALLSSLDDELCTLVSATEGVVASKKTWQETSESFFQRNIELSQRVAQLENEQAQSAASQSKVQRDLDAARASIATLESQLASLQSLHTSKLVELAASSQKSSSDLRQHRAEAERLFEKSVDLNRRVREGELAASELEKKEIRLLARNESLLQERAKIEAAIRAARDIEAALARGNAKTYAMLVASAAQGAALQPSLGLGGTHQRTLRSSHGSSAHIGLQQQPPQQLLLHDSSQPHLQSQSPRSGSVGVAQNAHTQSLPQFSRTMPASPSSSASAAGLHTVASTGSLAAVPTPPGEDGTGAGSGAVLATIRARPSQAQTQQQQQQQQQQQPQQLMSAAQWTALASPPQSPQPHTARPSPPTSPSASMQPLRAKRGGAHSNGSQSARGSEKAAAAASARAIAVALHRDSLDRALFRAAKAGLGRGGQHSRSPSKARSHKDQAGSPHAAAAAAAASFAEQSDEKESATPLLLPPLPPSTPLRDMMDTKQ